MGVTVLPEGTAEGARVQGGKQAFTNQTQSDWVRPTDWPALPDVKATDNKVAGLVAVTNDDANFLALSVTVAGATSITFAGLDRAGSSTDASTYTTPSETLTAGRTYILSVENSHGSNASAVSAITSATSGVPTFGVQATTQFNSNLNRVTVLTCAPNATWTGALTINFGGTTQTGCIWTIVEVTGIGNGTSDGVIQAVTATGSSGTASVTLAALAAGSASFGVQAHASTAASAPGTGYTEIDDVTTSTPAQALQTIRAVAGSTTVDATFTSASWGMIGLELRRGSYTVDWGDGNTESVVSGTQANHQYVYGSVTLPLTTAGYKVASVLVTPNGYITTLSMRAKHSQTGLQDDYAVGWLDLVVSAPVMTTFSLGGATGSGTIRARMLQRMRLLSSALTSFSSTFQNLSQLREVSVTSSATVTTVANMFDSCASLTRVPVFTTSSATSCNSMFNGCTSLVEVPAFNFSSVTNAGSFVNTCLSLRSIQTMSFAAVTTAPTLSSLPALASVGITGLTRGVSISGAAMSKAAIETLMDNLGTASGAQTVTISSNWGAPTAISKTSSGTTSGSTTVTISDTSSLTTGMEISGTGISDAVAVTFQDTGDTVTRTAHGIPNDTPVSFATVVTTTGIATYTRYYVVNAAADTFQVSDTVGGAAKALTTDGSGTCLYGTTISSITANTSITLSIPASATGSVTTSSALLKRSKARLKGFTVSG